MRPCANSCLVRDRIRIAAGHGAEYVGSMHRVTSFSKWATWKQFTIAICLAMLAGIGRAESPCCNPGAGAFSGKAVESMNVATYTYVLVDTGKKKLWVAAPRFAVKTGDKVEVANAMAMPDYESKTLKRKFDVVYFTGSVSVNGRNANERPASAAASGELPPGHPKIDGAVAASVSDFSKITKPAGGKTVSEIVDGRKQLQGREVTVRGKVVKYSSGVMGKNWLHIRDGSGTPANNDLTVTTDTPAAVGSTVLVKGRLSTDRDFGSGYFYPVIVENAQVTVE